VSVERRERARLVEQFPDDGAAKAGPQAEAALLRSLCRGHLVAYAR
jgi:hypothetical protein